MSVAAQGRSIQPDLAHSRKLLLLFWVGSLPVSAQVLELNGGASSLYEAQGAELLYRTPTYQSFVSAGMSSGHLIVGANVTHKTATSTISAGMEQLSLDLPTDFAADHRLQGVGAGLHTVRGASTIDIFAGALSNWLSTPIFRGAQVEGFAAAFVVHHRFTEKLEGLSQTVYASRFAQLESVRWHPSERMTAAVSCGLSRHGLYSAVTLGVKRPLFDLHAGYTASTSKFERAGVEAGITAEPVGARIDVTVRSSLNPRYSGTFSHDSFLLSSFTAGSPGSSATSSVDSGSGSAHFDNLGLTAAVIHSTFEGQQTLALTVSAEYPVLPRVHVQSSYFESLRLNASEPTPASRTLLTNVTETIGPRLSASEVFSYSGGQPSLGFGGTIANNWVTLNAEMQTFYIPTRPDNPFQQSLIVNLELDVVGRLRVLGSTFVSPNGKLLYNSEAHALAVPSLGGSRKPAQPKFGNSVLHGRVLNERAEPITGAAVDVDGVLLFTDSEGRFFLREQGQNQHAVKIRTEQFLDGYHYRVLREPKTLASHRHGDTERLDHVGTSGRPSEASFIVTRVAFATPLASGGGIAGTGTPK